MRAGAPTRAAPGSRMVSMMIVAPAPGRPAHPDETTCEPLMKNCSTLPSITIRPRAPDARSARAGRLALASLLGLCLAGLTTLATAAPAPAPGDPQVVEKRIADMHTRLHIDATQEAQWLVVARTMRENQAALEPLIAERAKNAPSATALQDLDSFATVSEAHAGGIRRFIAAFEPLYTAMPAAQKKEADTLFRAGPGKMGASK